MRDGLHWAGTAVLLAAIGTAFVATWPNLGAVRSHGDTSLLHDAAARRALTKELVTTPFTEALARWQRQANWLLLRDLGPEVKRGEDNWLFLDEELQLHRDRAAHATARAEAVSAIARALADRHIALLVVVVPDKSRIEAAHLGTLRRPPQLDARVRDWTAKLGAANVAALDLSPVLAGASPSPFLHTDTHWNERGSWLAAHAVAQRLQELHALRGEPVPSVVVSKQVREVHGDLLHLAGIDGLPASLQPAPDTDTQSVVETRNESTDLFGTAAVPSTVLIGTSFSRRSNFVPFLQLASRALVADFAMDGGDFSGAARRYLAGEDFVKTPPRTIVWEVPERAIEAPIGEAEAQWLRQPLPLR
ncbi:cell division protein FtsQ [Variovorax sp. J22G73]|uniref:alginate O-acetyltransferase AlgX-related protein n=1 Tax=unclassified Variovorax TaxID=663243 RepID=UPI0014027659|nr:MULTISPECIES: cell division protein FtsQ [unclassified Variovorax]MDM0006629.1 cell division protein FtsQ [Variovorax sp. J22R203]MDM0097347.1 cell division protein FtsQ [Variovorax sp. J22G73]